MEDRNKKQNKRLKERVRALQSQLDDYKARDYYLSVKTREVEELGARREAEIESLKNKKEELDLQMRELRVLVTEMRKALNKRGE